MSKPPSACKDCKDRKPTCHVHCQQYKAWALMHYIEKEKERQQKEKALIADAPRRMKGRRERGSRPHI